MTIDQIRSDTNFLLNTSTSNYPDADVIRNVNIHLDNAVSLILGADGRWEWDDTNNTDLPIGTATLVHNQQDYAISGATFLNILRVEVKDINGNYYLLDPISQHKVTSQALSEFQKTAGRPRFYDKIGDSVFLYPKPSTANVTASAGLKVYFQRVGSYFLTSDTTKVPGFAPLYHRLLSVGAALDYAIANGLTGKINILTPMQQKLETGLVGFYSARSKDESVHMSLRKEDYGRDDYGSGYRGSDKAVWW